MTKSKNWDLERKTIQQVVKRFMDKGFKIPSYDAEDLIQETFCHFIDKGFFEKYNPGITSYRYFIWAATKNYLITLSKKSSLNFLSLDRVIGDSSNSESFLDQCADPRDMVEELIRKNLVEKIIESLSPDSVSPSYFLSMRTLFMEHFLYYRKPVQIAENVINRNNGKSITTGRVSQLIKQLKKELRKAVLRLQPELIGM